MILIHTSVPRTASTWLEGLFGELAKDLVLFKPSRGLKVYQDFLVAGGLPDWHLFVGVFLPWEKLELATCAFPYRILHVKRDPRDILVSWYYSLKHSHSMQSEFYSNVRQKLSTLPEDEGMTYLLDQFSDIVQRLTSYCGKTDDDHCQTVDFTVLTKEPAKVLGTFFRNAGFAVKDQHIEAISARRSFSKLAEGRLEGQEDVTHHMRKGIAGDWKSKFTPHLRNTFKARFGPDLIRLGYETGDDW